MEKITLNAIYPLFFLSQIEKYDNYEFNYFELVSKFWLCFQMHWSFPIYVLVLSSKRK